MQKEKYARRGLGNSLWKEMYLPLERKTFLPLERKRYLALERKTMYLRLERKIVSGDKDVLAC